jgi:predicted aldo/keto reductase-like oxidoreductase
MKYRRLGRTERQVSLLGIGGGYIMLRSIEDGIRIYQRAAELGVNYFDGRYGATSTMQKPVIRQDRTHFIVATKTANHTRDGALERIDEDLREIDTDYLDIFYLRAYNQEMIDSHFAPGGSIEGLRKAKEAGKIKHLGLAGHSDLNALARGVKTGLIDVVEFPLNVIRREALEQLVPVCQEYDVGMVIMKPVNVGLVPAEVCLPWLANQPIHVMAPGLSTMEHLEKDVSVLEREPMDLSQDELAQIQYWQDKMDTETCRICDKACHVVCEQELSIAYMAYHNVFQNELRRLGAKGFVEYPFAPWVKERAEFIFSTGLAQLEMCTHCGKCEEVCPYHLPVMDILERVKENHREVLKLIKEINWSAKNREADSPFSDKVLASWIGAKDKTSS